MGGTQSRGRLQAQMHGVWASDHGAQKNRGEKHTRSEVGKIYSALGDYCLLYLYPDRISKIFELSL